ncbi:hypothetical protein FCV97_20685 [Escherichia coli]|nr:hypothetical protein [Escherichia coli]
MKSMDKLTTGIAYGTSAGSAGYWFLQLLDKVTPSQWAAIGVLGSLVRAGGRNPDDVKRRRKAEIDENRKLDLVFDTDPASDKGGSSAATKRQEPQHTDDQSEE